MILRETLPLSDITPGMRLVDTLLDGRGGVLLAAGSEINSDIVHGLQRRGITALRVERQRNEAAEALGVRRARVAGRLDKLFRQAGESPETRLLYQYILAYRMEEG